MADSEGEALLQLLAAYAFAPSPVLLDVTDGATHTLYTIRGREVITWREVNSTQAGFQAECDEIVLSIISLHSYDVAVVVCMVVKRSARFVRFTVSKAQCEDSVR